MSIFWGQRFHRFAQEIKDKIFSRLRLHLDVIITLILHFGLSEKTEKRLCTTFNA